MKSTKLKRYFVLIVVVLLQFVLIHCSNTDRGHIPITTSSEVALEHFQRGLDLYDVLRNGEAYRHFQRALNADPDFALAYLYAALTNPSAKGFFDNLRQAKKHVGDVSPGERLLVRSTEAGANGDPALQRELLLELVGIYPNDERALMSLANYYFTQQEYELAVTQYEAIVKMTPSFAPPYNMLGYSYRSLDNYEAAVDAFKTYTELIPDDPNPYDSYAELLSRMGKFEEAISHYRKALELEPTFGVSRQGIAANLVFLGRYNEAREELAEYFEAAINSGQQRAALGAAALTYVDEGDLDNAITQLRKQYEIAEAIPDAAAMAGDLGNMAFVQLLAHRPDKAAQNLDQSLRVVEESDLFERVKRNARLDNLLGRALIDLERSRLSRARQAAEEYLAKAEPLMNPFRVRNAHQVLGRIALTGGDYDRAISELEQADQQQAWTLFHLAAAYEGKGDLTRAGELYRQAASMYQLGSLTYAAIRLESEKRAAAIESQLSS